MCYTVTKYITTVTYVSTFAYKCEGAHILRRPNNMLDIQKRQRGTTFRWRLPKRLINYSYPSAAGKAYCKLLQDTSWDLETPEKADLGSNTPEQSLLPWLNVVKHETTQLLQCLDEWFWCTSPASSFACYSLLVTIYPAQSNCTNPCVGPECKIFTREVTVQEQDSLWSGSCRKNIAVWSLSASSAS